MHSSGWAMTRKLWEHTAHLAVLRAGGGGGNSSVQWAVDAMLVAHTSHTSAWLSRAPESFLQRCFLCFKSFQETRWKMLASLIQNIWNCLERGLCRWQRKEAWRGQGTLHMEKQKSVLLERIDDMDHKDQKVRSLSWEATSWIHFHFRCWKRSLKDEPGIWAHPPKDWLKFISFVWQLSMLGTHYNHPGNLKRKETWMRVSYWSITLGVLVCLQVFKAPPVAVMWHEGWAFGLGQCNKEA